MCEYIAIMNMHRGTVLLCIGKPVFFRNVIDESSSQTEVLSSLTLQQIVYHYLYNTTLQLQYSTRNSLSRTVASTSGRHVIQIQLQYIEYILVYTQSIIVYSIYSQRGYRRALSKVLMDVLVLPALLVLLGLLDFRISGGFFSKCANMFVCASNCTRDVRVYVYPWINLFQRVNPVSFHDP